MDVLMILRYMASDSQTCLVSIRAIMSGWSLFMYVTISFRLRLFMPFILYDMMRRLGRGWKLSSFCCRVFLLLCITCFWCVVLLCVSEFFVDMLSVGMDVCVLDVGCVCWGDCITFDV